MNTGARRWVWRSICAVAIIFLALAGVHWVLIWTGMEPWSLRKWRFARAAHKGTRLIRAIEQYQKDRSVPPDSLGALVPEYLSKIPGTGLTDYPKFEYARFTNSQYWLMWYDLGSRNGQPTTGLWCYPDGDADHAILAITIDQGGRVVEAYADRLPKLDQTNGFDEYRWRSKDQRMGMVRSIPDHLQIPGANTNAVLSMLGHPEGSRLLRDSPWELRIKCPWGMLNWDVFFYWPTEKYPKYIYGGSTELIGRWAYVHE